MRRIFSVLIALMIFTGVRAQVKITGSVRDNTNEAIAGVTVVVKGTSKGVQTDANGKFSLTVPSEKSTVSVSYIGMQTQTFQPGKQRVFDIVLEDMENSLDEAVVVPMLPTMFFRIMWTASMPLKSRRLS